MGTWEAMMSLPAPDPLTSTVPACQIVPVLASFLLMGDEYRMEISSLPAGAPGQLAPVRFLPPSSFLLSQIHSIQAYAPAA